MEMSLRARGRVAAACLALGFAATSNGGASAEQQLSVVYAFQGGADGWGPSSLVFDDAGNLYGTTSGGGSTNCIGGCGIVFKIAADGTKTTLHTFTGEPATDRFLLAWPWTGTATSMGRRWEAAAAASAPSSS